jgi:hypothetical protein
MSSNEIETTGEYDADEAECLATSPRAGQYDGTKAVKLQEGWESGIEQGAG